MADKVINNIKLPNGEIYSVGGAGRFGIKGDYSTHYGIEYCQHGLIENPVGTTDIVVKCGMMLCLPGAETKTTIGSDITYSVSSLTDVTIFYAEGDILEAGEVHYSVSEPSDNGIENYIAWWNPDVGKWQFKSNDTGNVWREAVATPIADIRIEEGNIVRIDYIGYRLLNDDIYGLKSETANVDLSNLTEEGINFIIKNSAGASLFDTKLVDHILAFEESEGWALQGTYVYKDAVAGSRYGYPDFYAKCVEESELGTPTETTLGNSTITMYINANGHQFYDIADKEAVDAWYSTYGIAWYYGIDKENERIFLPRTKWFIQPSGEITEVNTVNEAGLPNIEGGFQATINQIGSPSGAFSATIGSCNTANEGNANANRYWTFDASRSNSTYGNSTTVQPPSINQLLYICVGNTTVDASHIDVVTQVENGVKDIDDAVNDGVSRLNSIDALKTTQLTNCLLEVPQSIKLELADGVLTLKADSVVIVPYGTEDLTSQYPKGATFLHENFKVYDTQFEDGKFFVWAEVQSDIVDGDKAATDNNIRPLQVDITQNNLFHFSITSSGTTDYDGRYNSAVYRTDLNIIKKWEMDIGLTSNVSSLPICTIKSNVSTKYVYESIPQVFNGMGYIGSTVWIDKGVKGLIPNGRNEDGSLRNIEYTNNKIRIATFTGGYADTFWLRLSSTGTLPNHSAQIRYNIKSFFNAPTPTVGKWYSVYVEDENMFYYSNNGGAYFKDLALDLGVYSASADNKITSLNPKQPFRAIDYSDKSEVSGWSFPSSKYIDLTLNASGSTYTAPANGWVSCVLDLNAGGNMSMQTSYLFDWHQGNSSYGSYAGGIVPVRKGSTFLINYSNARGTVNFRFVYAEGEQ